ncbi:uncharacterized protein CEXT_813431, partial [Caerostris extrusa]
VVSLCCEFVVDAYQTKSTAEITGWINVLLWGCLVGIEGLRLARNRRAISREVYEDQSSSDAVQIGEVLPTA